MKHTIMIIAIVLFTVLSFAQANAGNNNDTVKTLPVELKYAGTFKDQPVLQMNFFGSKEDNEFSISITDGSGYTFYSATVKGEKNSKQFLLDTENLGDATLRFEISSRKSGKTVVYQVSRKTNISEQMDLVKL